MENDAPWWDDDGDDASDSGSSRPPEYVGISTQDLMDELDAEAQARAAKISGEALTAGFWPRDSSGPAKRRDPGSKAGSDSTSEQSSPRPGPTSLTDSTSQFRSWSRSGFGSGGDLDVLKPCPSLAGLTDAATRDGQLTDLDDDELIGVLRAWRRLESWSAAGGLSAIAELARRRPADRSAPARPGAFPEQMSEFISDEIAAALALSGQAASACLDLALDLALRLPGTARALREGVIDYLKARIIAEATKVLSDEDARAVEARILAAAGRQTTGQLRAALARAVLSVDPEAAARRREEAQRDPRVRRWREDAGTAALAGYGLPPADVLEADQHLTSRALDLRDAGLKGTLDELRARAYLDALLGRDSLSQVSSSGDVAPGASSAPDSSAPDVPAGSEPRNCDADHPSAGSDPSPGPRSSGAPGPPPSGAPGPPPSGAPDPQPSGAPGPQASGAPGLPPSGAPGAQPSGSQGPQPSTAPTRQPPSSPNSHSSADASHSVERQSSGARTSPGNGGRLAARVNLTVPLTTLLGLANEPAEVAGFGPLDPALAREVGARAGTHPATRWCLTVIDDAGQAIGHGCLPGRRPAELFTHASGGAGPGDRAGPGPAGGHGRGTSQAMVSGVVARDFTVKICALAREMCDHRNEEPGYEPSRRLRHLIRARNATCTAPGCRRAAARCDLDHTQPYDEGGRTCECDLAPLCRHHHRCKQAEGWRLEQTSPGIMCWTTPAGRHYVTTPSTYS